MKALRTLVERAYNALFPPVNPPELPDVVNRTPEEIAEYNARVAAWFDRKERESAAVRRELAAEETNMRRRGAQ